MEALKFGVYTGNATRGRRSSLSLVVIYSGAVSVGSMPDGCGAGRRTGCFNRNFDRISGFGEETKEIVFSLDHFYQSSEPRLTAKDSQIRPSDGGARQSTTSVYPITGDTLPMAFKQYTPLMPKVFWAEVRRIESGDAATESR